MFPQRGQSVKDSLQSVYWFSVVFREFQTKNHQRIQPLICQTIILSVSRRLYTFLQWISVFCFVCWFLLHIAITMSISKFTCCCFRHRFRFKISKNKSIRFVFFHIFQVIFYSNLSFLYLALNHFHPLSSFLSLSQFGPFFPCLDIYSVLIT